MAFQRGGGLKSQIPLALSPRKLTRRLLWNRERIEHIMRVGEEEAKITRQPETTYVMKALKAGTVRIAQEMFDPMPLDDDPVLDETLRPFLEEPSGLFDFFQKNRLFQQPLLLSPPISECDTLPPCSTATNFAAF
jgi:hypothetical protein